MVSLDFSEDFALRAYSSLSSLLFLMISTIMIAAITASNTQPKTGIQIAPKLPEVKRDPKKKVRNLIKIGGLII